ncbi:carbamate kinase [Streptosporangiaceae bacterium NEAU-GS5]|nr:carbamate kinase [Streptosporangiaceae bacterium NEAU-GS5]
MRIVAALGGNALLQRGEAPDAAVQLTHVAQAVHALAPLTADHELIITHGNGPQVGMLAVESANDTTLTAPYPMDVLTAQTQGMIGYWLVRELRNARSGLKVVGVLTDTLIDADDPAFDHPTKFVGPRYPPREAERIADARGWCLRPEGNPGQAMWRRVVASPEPLDILELSAITLLLDAGWVVVAAGGGGVPVTNGGSALGLSGLAGADAVIDKDLTAALLAERLQADALLLLTDVPAIMTGFGTPQARRLIRATPAQLRALPLAQGSMGPKAEAACRFTEHRPGVIAAIGSLTDAAALLTGRAGTLVRATPHDADHPQQVGGARA